MKVGKPVSKRKSVRLRHKIEKASNSKQRKNRKEAKKNPQWRSRLKKDPGIPNLFPYKDKILAEIEESRRRKEEEAQKRKDIARAQRLGTSAASSDKPVTGTTDEDEDLIDPEDVSDADPDESMDIEEDEDNADPMAALLASAQARANSHPQPVAGDLVRSDSDDEEDADGNEEWAGLDDSAPATAAPQGPKQTKPAHRPLPKRALEDPIKTVSALLTRLSATQDGIAQIIAHYKLPPLVVDGTSQAAHTRFLVEVARKRGRLGRGGVPNLHAAALTVLGDLNDERLKLPALSGRSVIASGTAVVGAAGGVKAASKSEVTIVQTMAEPFRLEGLFGDD